MAIELRKSIPDPELNTRIWGTSINPNSYYRALGETGDAAWNIYDDVLKSGAIRGSGGFSGDAYFSKGAPQGIYLHSQSSNLKELLKYYPESEVGNNNFLIEATEDFHPKNNPLYKPNETLRYRALPTIGGIPAPEGLAFPVGNSGSRWLTTVDSTGLPVPQGTYSVAAPAGDTTFLQRINPANQKNLRMLQAYTPSWSNSTIGFDGGVPPKWKTLFDYTKDFKNTSIPTHGKNLVHIGKTVLAQPETKAVLAAAGDATVKAGGAASFLLDAPEFYYDANKKRDADARTKAKANWWQDEDAILSFVNKPKSISEKLSLAAEASLKSAVNAVTFGAAYAGTGKNRPSRGLGEMEKSTDEMYRILKERGDKFLKQETPK